MSTGPVRSSHPGIIAWFFSPVRGAQNVVSESTQFFAVAVRPGDVVGPVPEPQSMALVLLALGAGRWRGVGGQSEALALRVFRLLCGFGGVGLQPR